MMGNLNNENSVEMSTRFINFLPNSTYKRILWNTLRQSFPQYEIDRDRNVVILVKFLKSLSEPILE